MVRVRVMVGVRLRVMVGVRFRLRVGVRVGVGYRFGVRVHLAWLIRAPQWESESFLQVLTCLQAHADTRLTPFIGKRS